MHYKDGVEAKIGDIAKGVPYNNEGKTIVGTVTQLTPGYDSCNLQIVFIKIGKPVFGSVAVYRAPTGVVENYEPLPLVEYQIGHDYGRVGDFELVHRSE